jgi:HNH endonuclease
VPRKPNTLCRGGCGKQMYSASPDGTHPVCRACTRSAVCIVEGCSKPRDSLGLCKAHWHRRKRGSELDTPIRDRLPDRTNMSDYEKTMDLTESVGDCIEYAGKRDRHGYGVLSRGVRTHVAVWVHHNGPVPDGLLVRHICDNPPCVKIEHLLLGTVKDNMWDAIERGRFCEGERSPSAKLTAEQVRAIRADQRPSKEIALEYGLSDRHVRRIQSRDTWKRLP